MNSLGLGDAVVLLPSDENIENGISGETGVIVGGGIEDGVQMFNIALDKRPTVPLAATGLKLRTQSKPPKQAQD